MSVIPIIRSVPPPSSPATPTEPIYPLSVEQYHAMIQAGVLTDDDPVELIEGLLVFRMPKNPPHARALAKLHEALFRMLPQGWVLRSQDPVTLADGEPEPDLVIARGTHDDYGDRHPGSVDLALLVEIADSTLSRDRGIKLRTYARAGIQQYWIINLIGRQVDVYSNPDREALQPRFRDQVPYGLDQAVPVTIEGIEIGRILPRDIIGA